VTAVLLPSAHGAHGEVTRRALRGATWLALTWGVSGLVMAVFSFGDTTGLPFTALPLTSFTGYDPEFPEAIPYLFGAVLALVLAAGASVTDTRRSALILLVLALYNVLPITTQGHAQHSWLTAYGLTLHFAAITLWVGGLAGLVIFARGSPDALAVAVPRFSVLALLCFVATGVSGVVMSWVNLEVLAEVWQSRYGLLATTKLTLLAALGVFGWWHRRRTVPAIAERHSRGAFIRLAVVEVIVMAAAAALGVALSDVETPGASH
ncbi:MAG: copper resistance D family protein, partial [Stackebrandtia sp.]